jgi:hypothetical protein
MALTLPLPEVQGSRIALGPGVWEATYLIIPGSSDYVTGGYVLSSLNLRCYSPNGIMGAWVSGCNAAANGYVVQPTLALAQVGTGTETGAEGYSQILFWVGWTGTGFSGVLAQIGSGGQLSGLIWELTVRGQ